MSEGDPWALGGDDEISVATQVQFSRQETHYAIEPARGCDARNHSDDLVTQIEDLPFYVDTARVIRRTVTYGPWQYVPEDELL